MHASKKIQALTLVDQSNGGDVTTAACDFQFAASQQQDSEVLPQVYLDGVTRVNPSI